MNRLAIIIAAAALFAACATIPPAAPLAAAPKSLACQTAPQWFTNDAAGRPANAVFVCFGENGQLLWTSRALTFDEILKLVTPAPAPAATPAAVVTHADPATAAPAAAPDAPAQLK